MEGQNFIQQPGVHFEEYINYSKENQVIALNCDKAQKGKVYLTTIDKDLQYMGEQSLKKLQLPARSIATIVIENK